MYVCVSSSNCFLSAFESYARNMMHSSRKLGIKFFCSGLSSVAGNGRTELYTVCGPQCPQSCEGRPKEGRVMNPHSCCEGHYGETSEGN